MSQVMSDIYNSILGQHSVGYRICGYAGEMYISKTPKGQSNVQLCKNLPDLIVSEFDHSKPSRISSLCKI